MDDSLFRGSLSWSFYISNKKINDGSQSSQNKRVININIKDNKKDMGQISNYQKTSRKY